MPPNNENGSWNEWKRHVLSELNRLCDCHSDLSKEVAKLRMAYEGQKIKMAIWGMFGGIIASGFVSVIVALIIRKAA